jgi:hypothetical protein
LAEKGKFPQPDVKRKDGEFLSFYNLFRQRFKISKQLIKRENEKDIRNPTVDS